MVIETDRLNLVLETPEEILASVAEDDEGMPCDWIERVHRAEPGDHWRLTFRTVERASSLVISHCSFQGPPDREGVVAIA